MAEDNRQLDLDTFRDRFDSKRDRSHWISAEELANEDSFMAMVSEEFPQQALPLSEGVDRRDFIKLMGSSLALAGVCVSATAEAIANFCNESNASLSR